MIPFAYYGGKNTHLANILAYLPNCDHYCEPFCGSAVVLLNRPLSPIETMNDKYGDLVNFFKVLRDRPGELITLLELTPYSFEEYKQAWLPCRSKIERARRFYIRTQMDRSKTGAQRKRAWSFVRNYLPGQHSYPARNFFEKMPGLYDVAERLKNVQIDNRSAIDCIRRCDTPGTLFYCDPPYLPETRNSSRDYKHEMSVQDHIDLSDVLNNILGRAAISGYDSPFMEKHYPHPKWTKITFPSRVVAMSGKGLVRQECLWVNYPVSIQKSIFDEINTI